MNYFAIKALTLIGGEPMVAQVQTLIKALQEAHDLGADSGRAAVIDELVGDDKAGKVNAHIEGMDYTKEFPEVFTKDGPVANSSVG